MHRKMKILKFMHFVSLIIIFRGGEVVNLSSGYDIFMKYKLSASQSMFTFYLLISLKFYCLFCKYYILFKNVGCARSEP